jgi:hypothetical protein
MFLGARTTAGWETQAPKSILDQPNAHAAATAHIQQTLALPSHHAFSLARTGSGMFLRAQTTAGGQCSLRCSQP